MKCPNCKKGYLILIETCTFYYCNNCDYQTVHKLKEVSKEE